MSAQAALRDKRVLLIGAGGLGSPAGTLLAQAGAGYIEVLDDDVVELSNLQRQTLYRESDVGRSKAQRAAEQLLVLARAAGHAHTEVQAREGRMRPDCALERVRGFDLVVEGSDNYPTKFLTADACQLARVSCVQAAAVRWVGWTLGCVPGESACLRCVFEDIPVGPVQGCATAGVIGPVVGVMGALQASIALRLLLGQKEAAGVLHHY
ncbi:MAG TPA: HesA/MoeB/ThiF family protein, partial [Polyangiales bacterium]|nr:HesA/MoeB/ThiF family protein [Polyangiales bacterium]